MGDDTLDGQTAMSTIDRVVARGRDSAGRSDVSEGFLRCYFAHVDRTDLAERTPQDLFGLAADHAALAADWERGTTAIAVVNPRIDVDGWENAHTVVMIVTDDLPFLVDSVTMELSRLELGIHLVIHPILTDVRDAADGGRGDAGPGFVNPRDHPEVLNRKSSFIAIEVDRRTEPEAIVAIEQHLRRVLGDVGAAVDDWSVMKDRMREISDGLASEPIPLAPAEVAETQELLDWLSNDHFVFIGYREYRLDDDALTADPSTGLGILRQRGAAAAPARLLRDMAPRARERAAAPELLNITKTAAKSTVHRAAHLDYVGIKTFGDDGTVTGERRFLGLFTAEAYTRATEQIPMLRRLVREVVDRSGFPTGGHDEKRLLTILEDYPRDELFQIDVDELFETSMAIAQLQERRRVRVFARPELFGRFVTCMVYMPRDRYNTATRSGIQKLLMDAYGGVNADWSTDITESVLSRTLFHIRIDADVVSDGIADDVDTAALESRIEELLRDWHDDLDAEVQRAFGEDDGPVIARRYGDAFAIEYREAFSARAAVADIHQLESIGDDGALRLSVYRDPGQPKNAFKIKLYRRGERVSLTSVMPALDNLGVTVLDERPYEVRPADGEPIWIYDFALESPADSLEFGQVSALLAETFDAVWRGDVANDGFNRLVLGAAMGPREVWILRAYSRYLQQTRITHSPAFVEQTLVDHPRAARLLVDLFATRFDPAGAADPTARAERVDALNASFFALVDDISSLDQDRVLRRFHNLIESTLRTNAHQRVDDAAPPYLAFKFDPRNITDLPEPRPRYEIYVYSARFEGVHLRAGSVARGGLRWSDRLEDYRTEVLGLVKAQMVKNAVIVPSGAKGGFVLKRPPSEPDALRDEVVACYRLFVSALLDLTDNLVDGEVVPPADTVRYDSDDTYLVVAADKGTATFSDIANELAMQRGLWLGDAFASGGSNGYDHKAMGITARGGWESVKRHFRELGKNIQEEPFTVVGIGDMSGDVFGNAMLLSPQIRLVAAFDHRHVFVDPDPDPVRSFDERRRLFETPRSNWADYDAELISEGGGVFPRSAKAIEVSPEMREALGLGDDVSSLPPDELIAAVLRAPVELLWNGGIGTYVKAAHETHADVGDKANDAIRIDGRELRAKVVGEGGNLGVTQLGRIEFASAGGRIYTDAIDNAGGVDCSDHEVNIKIALDRVTAAGDLTEKQRNELLEEMTGEVTMLVLADNYSQTQALSTARSQAAGMVDVHARYLSWLEGQGLIDRALEGLPDAETMGERMVSGEGLTTPELAVILAYTKNVLSDALLASDVPDDPIFEPILHAYFPSAMRERFADQIDGHRLRREILANRIANLVVERAGTTMLYRLGQETSAPLADVAAAHMAAWEIFRLGELGRAVNMLDAELPATRQLATHLSARQLAERATRLMLRSRPHPFSAADAVADLAVPVGDILDHIPDSLVGAELDAFENLSRRLAADGMSPPLARRVAALTPSLAALDIVEIAVRTGVDASTVAAVHFGVADRLDLNWLRDHILALPRDTQWTSLARLTLRGDLYTDHRDLTAQVVARAEDATDAEVLLDQWVARNTSPVDYFRRTLGDIRGAGPSDLTTLLVAGRELRSLINRTS
ncbi:MAG: NAD-glutamate dehydrogenase [Acidimicrobiales bacterium]